MVDVDDAVFKGRDKRLRKNLVIARQDEQVDAVFLQKLHFLLLLSALIAFRDENFMEGDAVMLRYRPGTGVIADDQRDLAVELAVGVPVEQVMQAMEVPGN